VQAPSLLPLSVQRLGYEEDESWEAEGEREEAVVFVERESEDVGEEDEGDLEVEDGVREGEGNHAGQERVSGQAEPVEVCSFVCLLGG
jgi:hypothetical protein